MAATLDKRLHGEEGVRDLGHYYETACKVISSTSSTDASGFPLFAKLSAETNAIAWELRGLESLRSTWSMILFNNMVTVLTTQEHGTTVEEDWPVADEFEGLATEDCVTFCNTRGLISNLRSCLKAVERIFSNTLALRAELDCFQDDDTEDEGHVVLRLVVASSQKVALREYRAWVEWFVANIEPDNRSYFTLTFTRKSK